MNLIHHHAWKVISVTPVNVYGEFSRSVPKRHDTHVSMVCRKCGKPRVKKMRGQIWSPA